MKVSEVTIEDLKNYARVDYNDDDILFHTILEGAKSHIKAYTGLTAEKIDLLPDTTIALFIISYEMYQNREGTSVNKSNNFNQMLDRILGTHSFNLL